MSANKWPPGPWQQGMSSGHNANIIYTGNDESIATVYGIPIHAQVSSVQDEERWQEGMANARLIAAAPDLAEALEACIEHMEHSTPRGRMAYIEAKHALAKARGEE